MKSIEEKYREINKYIIIQDSDQAVLYGYDNSTTQAYAEKWGLKFESLGPAPEDAPVHEHVQKTDYNWFVMNDGGYILTAVNMSDVKYYCWYRPE